MKMLFVSMVVVVTLLAFPQVISAQEPDPAAVVTAAAEAQSAWDLDTAQTFFADDAVYTLDFFDETYSGLAEIRPWWEDGVAQHYKIEVEVLSVEGDTVTTKTLTWYDITREAGIAPIEGTEVYVVQDGKIKTVRWTPTEESVTKFQTALAPESLPPAELPQTGGGSYPVFGVILLGSLLILAGLGLALRRRLVT